MSTIIKIENLSKKYVIGHQRQERYSTLRDVMMHKIRGIGERLRHPLSPNREKTDLEEFWALKDINLEIKQGDRVGIIGRNGAGKSTLLKILSRITEPTTGRIKIKGRVASLLEVGTGFHPELTGWENIFLNGAILGMSRVDIKKNFDEIVAFAEIEKFLDTPVKRYSSGMYVRLAFAVAAYLEPEILVVDEVLAVGDAQFQKKCLGKMEDVAQEGRTVLFVSHNMATITALCNKGILLENGEVSCKNSTEKVVSYYMQQRADLLPNYHYINNEILQANKKADVYEACVLDSTGNPSASILIDQPFSIRLIWRLNIAVPFLRCGIDIIDHMGIVILSTMDTDTTGLHGKPRSPGIFRERVFSPPFLLMPGSYSVRVFAGIPRVERIMEINDIVRFEILDNNSHLSHLTGARREGYISKPLKWSVKFNDA